LSAKLTRTLIRSLWENEKNEKFFLFYEFELEPDSLKSSPSLLKTQQINIERKLTKFNHTQNSTVKIPREGG